jgi:hypothetical protein
MKVALATDLKVSDWQVDFPLQVDSEVAVHIKYGVLDSSWAHIIYFSDLFVPFDKNGSPPWVEPRCRSGGSCSAFKIIPAVVLADERLLFQSGIGWQR